MTSSQTSKYEGLQSLRAIAALLVLSVHVGYITNPSGAVGVDIFFVLSGFVIALTAAKSGTTWKSFLVNRITRVVPFYYLMSIPLAINVLRQEDFEWHQLWNTIFFIPIFGSGLPTYH